jgi:asparagine synthase (glutamine-hydrolysing)
MNEPPMCGLLVVAGSGSRPPSVSDAVATTMRDTMSRRGPDGAGLLRDGPVLLAHRRLAITRVAENSQPLVAGTGEGRVAIVFNGELYDLDALRAELLRAGAEVRTGTDTELLALAIGLWGEQTFARVRGMFAVAAWRPAQRELLLARDALGVIPLHYALVATGEGTELVVASEPTPILAHPAMPIRPDLDSIANYLVTLRPECGGRTLFRGLRSVRPGHLIRCRLDHAEPRLEESRWWRPPAATLDVGPEEAASLVRSAVLDSVRAHLVADVPVVGLLSGGLDSAIVVACAREAGLSLPTFAGGFDEPDSDLDHARRAAASFGTRHHEAPVDEARFRARWPWLIDTVGWPLSTPNEVAIHALGERIRSSASVALSGEGADELFAGYGPALASAQAWIDAGAIGSPAIWHASAFAWIPPSAVGAVLAGQADLGATIAELESHFEGRDPRDLRSHLDVQRGLNLPNLLRRLNTNLMAASVEGRTPFADLRVAELAARLPMSTLLADDPEPESSAGGAVAVRTLPRTKRVLREAFADLLPETTLHRPKASFPIPFERWLAAHAAVVDTSSAARDLLSPEIRTIVRSSPAEHWRLAWPVINVGLWARRWFE